MNIIQCKMCRRPFHSLGNKICPECLERIEEDFIKVRDYIDENPRATSVDEIFEKTGVQKEIILHLLREGRLVADDTVVIEGGLVCEMCHRPVLSGKLCSECKKSVSETIQKNIGSADLRREQNRKKDTYRDGTRMHTDHYKKYE